MYSISRCNFQSGKRPEEMVVKEETRKGPWSEQEDLILVCHVRLFGERRWDFIARVSGLNRTGKSCRLRWLNYLHPGLKHGSLTPQEQCLILELHSKLGNRWSRIARKLPGRTDNEIKNYWRTHMRKKAHERENSSASLPTGCPSFCLAEPPVGEDCSSAGVSEKLGGVEVYPMELIWNEIATSELASGLSFEAGLNSSYCVWT